MNKPDFRKEVPTTEVMVVDEWVWEAAVVRYILPTFLGIFSLK